MPVGISMELNFCPKCNQMTNHFREYHYHPEKKEVLICLKCRAREGLPKITNFNKNMSEDERNYYGGEFNEKR